MVRPDGHYVIRFRSDNPGVRFLPALAVSPTSSIQYAAQLKLTRDLTPQVWLFHCHIEWHVDSGLIATIIEAPLELQLQKGFQPISSNPVSYTHLTLPTIYSV